MSIHKEPTPYDFVKDIFTNPNKAYQEYTNKQKGNFYFIVNRIMSIKFPIEAQKLNQIGVDAIAVVDYWIAKIGGKRYSMVPKWVYTKFASTNTQRKYKSLEFDKNVINYYLKKIQLPYNDFMQLLDEFDTNFAEEIKTIDKNKTFYNL